MTFFVPRFERFRDKKPSGPVELDWGHELSEDLFEFNYVDETGITNLVLNENRAVPAGGSNNDDEKSWHYFSTQYTNTNVLNPSECALFLIARVLDASSTNKWVYSESHTTIANPLLGIVAEGNKPRFVARDNDGVTASIIGDSLLGTSDFHSFSLDFNASSHARGYLDKKYEVGASFSGGQIGSDVSHINGLRNSTAYGISCDIALAVKYSKSKPPGWHEALHEAPYQILKSRRKYFPLTVAGGAAAALSGSASSTSNSTGIFHADIPLAGVSTTISRGQGAVSVAVPLSGISAALSGGAAGIAASVNLSASAIAQALAQAGISLDALMSGGASNTTTGAAGLSATGATAGLSGSGSASSSAQGDIVLQATLSGSAICTALADAGLVSGQALGGSASASAQGSGALVQNVPLAGSASAVAQGAGNVSALLPLDATAASAANMTGGLTVSASFSASALANALAQAGLDASTISSLSSSADAASTATGSLQLKAPLDAAALVNAVATGSLSEGVQNIPQIDRWTSTLNSRRLAVCV